MTKHGANLFELSKSYGFSKDEIMDFSSNINPLGSSSIARQRLRENVDMASIYPDPEYKDLKNSISSYCNSSQENIILGSGATELISSFISFVTPKNAVLISPAYSEYEKELQKIDSNIHKLFLDRKNDFKLNPQEIIDMANSLDSELIILCNPNNPTGSALTKDEIRQVLQNTDSYFMVDETYVEFFDPDIYSSSSLVDDYSRLFVIRGTSKFFSTPGIRLGYALTSDTNVHKCISSKLNLWNINIFATLMGEVMFTDKDYIKNTLSFVQNQVDYLTREINSIDGLKAYETKSNFILINIENMRYTAGQLYDRLVPFKIAIRNAKSFEGLDEYFFRVCVLNKDENEFLIKKLKEAFN